MKKQIAFLLIASTLASVLSLASCKQKSTSENPFDMGAVTSAGSGQANNDPNTGWTADNPHGEKIMYGKENSSISSSILCYGDMLIGRTNYSNLLGYYSFDEPDKAKLICFDPLCIHLPGQESCSAVINKYYNKDETVEFPEGMYLDLYENSQSPVIYFYYRRSINYTISIDEFGSREPVYCIERYDLSQGKRYTVLDHVESTIQQVCNYGDYIYYVLDVSEGEQQMQKLCRVHKSGTEPEAIDFTELPQSIEIIDGIDEHIFYLVDERYLYRSSLDLTDSEIVLDMNEVKGKSGSNSVIQGSYSGFLYYLADFETVWAGEPEQTPSAVKANLYRISMNDLTGAPAKVVEGMIGSGDCYRFTEKTLYYEPCIYEYSEGGVTAINECDGKMLALDLKTGKSKLIVENSRMTIYPLNAWDDRVLFAGWAYNSLGNEYSGNNQNLLIAYASGESFKIWCKKSVRGIIDDEYMELIHAAQKAAMDQLETK